MGADPGTVHQRVRADDHPGDALHPCAVLRPTSTGRTEEKRGAASEPHVPTGGRQECMCAPIKHLHIQPKHGLTTSYSESRSWGCRLCQVSALSHTNDRPMKTGACCRIIHESGASLEPAGFGKAQGPELRAPHFIRHAEPAVIRKHLMPSRPLRSCTPWRTTVESKTDEPGPPSEWQVQATRNNLRRAHLALAADCRVQIAWRNCVRRCCRSPRRAVADLRKADIEAICAGPAERPRAGCAKQAARMQHVQAGRTA